MQRFSNDASSVRRLYQRDHQSASTATRSRASHPDPLLFGCRTERAAMSPDPGNSGLDRQPDLGSRSDGFGGEALDCPEEHPARQGALEIRLPSASVLRERLAGRR